MWYGPVYFCKNLSLINSKELNVIFNNKNYTVELYYWTKLLNYIVEQ